MKKLWLVRHAKSSWKRPDMDDFDRPLNKRGMRDAPEMGKYLAKQGIFPRAVVTSPAKRARDTTAALASAMYVRSSGIVEDRRIYAASISILLDVIRGWDDAWDKVMMVGHNPGIAEITAVLTQMETNVPTCTVMELGLDVIGWNNVVPGCGTLRFRITPKAIRMDP